MDNLSTFYWTEKMIQFHGVIVVLLLCVISFKNNLTNASMHGFSTQEYNNTMLWGSKTKKKFKNFQAYRPNLYFGMKTRKINPTQTGFMCKKFKKSTKNRVQHQQLS
jgi:hypothetical protein